MSVVRVIDIMAQSEESWEDATRHAVAEASQAYPEILSLRVNRLEAVVEQDEVTFFRVKLKVAHVLDTEGAGDDDQGEDNFEDEDEFGPEQGFGGDQEASQGEFGNDQREMAAQSYGDEYEDESAGGDYPGPAGRNSGFGGDDEQMRQRGGGGRASGMRRGPSGGDQQFAGGAWLASGATSWRNEQWLKEPPRRGGLALPDAAAAELAAARHNAQGLWMLRPAAALPPTARRQRRSPRPIGKPRRRRGAVPAARG